MKLKDLIEMAAPDMAPENIQGAGQATEAIQRAYEAAIVRKQPNEDVYGPLVSALKWISQQPNPGAFKDLVRKGTAAANAIKANRARLSSAQAQSTTVRSLR
jgi:hypothetical protein